MLLTPAYTGAMSTLPAAGAPAPPFTLADASGRQRSFGGGSPHAATLLFFIKHDCATCGLTAPAVERVARALSPSGLAVVAVSQSNAADTAAFASRNGLSFTTVLDAELDVSDAYGFDAVPALVLTGSDAVLLATMEGWSKSDFRELVALAAERCGSAPPAIELDGETLPEMRPGCASRVNDPDIARRLAVRRGDEQLASRRIRVPMEPGADEFDFLFDRGLSDGLPVVPPTEARVLRMLEGTSRAATDVVAHVPPNLAPATVEKVAINAVMAGCRPEYLPVVLAAVEAACTDAFNLHGVLATTYFVGPLIIVNGPIRHEIGINCGPNVFGQGARANATIGRALQLLVRNVGGGRPGEVDMATLGQPGKVGACIGELEEQSCWEPLHVERGFEPEQSTVTVFAAEAPRAIRDQLSRGGRSLAASIGLSLESIAHVKLHGMDQALLVVSPEHARTFARDGYTKEDVRARIQEITARPLKELLPNDDCHKGMRPQALPQDWLDAYGQPTPAALERRIAKFSSPENILIMVAGGTAGKFSAAIGGWASGEAGSKAVTRVIER